MLQKNFFFFEKESFDELSNQRCKWTSCFQKKLKFTFMNRRLRSLEFNRILIYDICLSFESGNLFDKFYIEN